MPMLPTPPTDNLYKFVAIIGMWIFGFTMLFAGTLFFSAYKYEVLLGQQAQISTLNLDVIHADRRIDAINKGELSAYKIQGFSDFKDPQEEKRFLTNWKRYVVSNIETIDNQVDREKRDNFDQIQVLGVFAIPVDDYVKLLDSAWILAAIEVPLCLSLLMIYTGFTRWYILYQRPRDLQAKEALRISQLNKKPKGAFARLRELFLWFFEMEDHDRHRARFIDSSIGAIVISAAFQRGNVYRGGKVDPKLKLALRQAVFAVVKDCAASYEKPVTEEQHFNNLIRISKTITGGYGSILRDGRFRIGTAQKALNLYLKYLWCFGRIVIPPHCPVDRMILDKVKLNHGINWTKLDSIEDYREAIEILKQAAGKIPLAEWEISNYGTPNFPFLVEEV